MKCYLKNYFFEALRQDLRTHFLFYCRCPLNFSGKINTSKHSRHFGHFPLQFMSAAGLLTSDMLDTTSWVIFSNNLKTTYLLVYAQVLLSIIQGTLHTKTCHFLLTPSLFSRQNHTTTKLQLVSAVALPNIREESCEKVMLQNTNISWTSNCTVSSKKPTFTSLFPIFIPLTVFLKAWADPHLGVSPCSTVPEGSACSPYCVHHPE